MSNLYGYILLSSFKLQKVYQTKTTSIIFSFFFVFSPFFFFFFCQSFLCKVFTPSKYLTKIKSKSQMYNQKQF